MKSMMDLFEFLVVTLVFIIMHEIYIKYALYIVLAITIYIVFCMKAVRSVYFPNVYSCNYILCITRFHSLSYIFILSLANCIMAVKFCGVD